MKIYISGKISGLDYCCAVKKFRESEVLSDKNYPNSPVINPLDILPLFSVEKWLFYMIADIYQLLKCDAILLQPDWMIQKAKRLKLSLQY